jgi:DNA polymerase elongation subunit (family B)
LHGGRTEVFRMGRVRGPVHCLDVNSMYPAVMATESFPTSLRLFARNVSIAELTRWLEAHAVVARCRLRTERRRFACVHKGRLVFPIGRLSLALTTPDLKDALEHGEVESVECAAVYDQAPIFARFVAELYSLRAKATAAREDVSSWLLKILMNSLYGKFAQRGEKWETIGQTKDRSVQSWVEWDVVGGQRYRFRQFGGAVQQRSVEPEGHDSHPAIAAHITAYARARLWSLIQLAGPAEVFYVDTDSLFVSHRGLSRLRPHLDSARLGALKYERRHEWLRVFGAKDYATPDKRVTKGVRASATWLAPNVVSQEQWSSLPGLLGSGQLKAPTTRNVVKTLRRVYEKGVVEIGGSVSPLDLRDW